MTKGGVVEKSTAKSATDLRDRIAAVLIDAAEFRGVYQLHNPDMKFLADAVIEELGLRVESIDEGRRRRVRVVSDWERADDE